MKRKLWLVLSVPLVALMYFGLHSYSQKPYAPYNISADDPDPVAELGQWWEDNERALWYEASQGSRMLPLEWLEALEQKESNDLFMAADNVKKYNFIPRKTKVPGREKDAQLSFGLVIDNGSDENLQQTKLRWKENQSDKEPWVGFTCAACHTTNISYKGSNIRVEGGGSLIDFQSFVGALNRALYETFINEEKWQRFEARVLTATQSSPPKQDSKDKLRAEYKKLLDRHIKLGKSNSTHVDYGYGRIDAFGHIYNKVALLLDEDNPQFNTPDAPVSIPHIWNAPQYNKVQYNGAAPKAYYWGVDVGALVRNVGEFVGTYGDVVVAKSLNNDGFKSSVDIKNLYYLERTLESLRSPKWPEDIFGPFTPEEKQKEAKLAAKGRDLYNKNCLLCHDVVDRTDTKSEIHVQDNYFIYGTQIAKERVKNLPASLQNKRILPLATDPWMACNAYADTAKPGIWSSDEEEAMEVDYGSIGSGEPIRLGKRIEVSKLMTVTVAGVLAANRGDLTGIIGENFLSMPRIPKGISAIDQDSTLIDLGGQWENANRDNDKSKRLQDCLSVSVAFSKTKPENNPLGYTSRPLNGIWASPPYLHNGSVPTLYDLLTPSSKRPLSFWTGSREFDPVKVGFVTEKSESNRFLFESRRRLGNHLAHIDGNTNTGHNYNNASFSHEDRMAIIAYLKTL